MKTDGRALRLAKWFDRRRWAILATSLALTLGAGVLAAQLPVRGDFSYLLPPDAPSVVALRQLEQRVRNLGTLLIVVESDDVALRARAAEELRGRLDALDDGLITSVSFDDNAARQFVWQNRFLYADKKDLETARDELADKIRRTKLAANPLYVDFEDQAKPAAGSGSADQLEAKRKDAEARKDAPGTFVSKDGRMQ